jgi:3-deoxy-manno-octulosonate cytidylyltransferase (CMP-KDO synthetase)
MNDREQKVLGVIPARLGSTRIPNKMLVDIGGRKLIERTVERTKACTSLDKLIVSTDSEEIANVVRALDIDVIMTESDLPTGTDRVAATVEKFTEFEPDIVSVIWGDEPLYPAEAIDKSVELLLEDEDLLVSSVGDLIEDPEMWARPSVVKIITDFAGNVMYITRAQVPHPYNASVPVEVHHIIGVMTVRKPFLKKFIEFPQTPLEKREGVEQMRILENGYRMRIVKGNYHSLGVNTPEELEKVREIYKQREGKV